MPYAVKLLDRGGNVIATAAVSPEGGGYVGTARVAEAPVAARQLFDEFEALVDQQVFSLLDRLEDQIAALAISAVFGDGRAAPVVDLQLFPRARTISFKL